MSVYPDNGVEVAGFFGLDCGSKPVNLNGNQKKTGCRTNEKSISEKNHKRNV